MSLLSIRYIVLVGVMLTVNVCYDHSDFLQYSNQPDISQYRNVIVRANENKVTNGKCSDKWQREKVGTKQKQLQDSQDPCIAVGCSISRLTC